MKFDEKGKRIVVAPIVTGESKETPYWYEQESVDMYGFCDKPVTCSDGFDITHLCGRFRGHGGSCAAVVKVTSGGRTTRRVEYA